MTAACSLFAGIGGFDLALAANGIRTAWVSEQGVRHYAGGGDNPTLLGAARRGDAGLWPTPKASPSGPDFARAGREGSGGDDLATAVVRDEHCSGALNPTWVEWLMGFPLGWTDLSVDAGPVHAWASEPDGVPRTAADVPQRRERLTALGNALVPQVAALVIGRAIAALEVSSPEAVSA